MDWLTNIAYLAYACGKVVAWDFNKKFHATVYEDKNDDGIQFIAAFPTKGCDNFLFTREIRRDCFETEGSTRVIVNFVYRLLFWTQRTTIRRSHMDGSNSTILVKTESHAIIGGLAVDYNTSLIY